MEINLAELRTRLIKLFPNLEKDFQIIADQNPDSNCISYSLGYMMFKVWPIEFSNGLNRYPDGSRIFWPKGLSSSESLDNFIKMYKMFKFEVCDNDSFEEEYIKIAIYTKDDIVTHACRQLHTEANVWASKLGIGGVIRHRLYSLKSNTYGDVACIMKRHISISSKQFRKLVEG